MQASVEAAFGQHGLDVAMFFEKTAASILVAIKECHGHKSHGHHLGGCEFCLRGVLVAPGL